MDWQSVIVALTVLTASAYVAWRGWKRLQSVVNPKFGVRSGCGGSCGSCAGKKRIPDKKVR